jgi:hypothetical protein
MVTDRGWIDPGFKPGRIDLDASYTYDGYLIVSERFRSLAAGDGVRFHELPSAPGFYSVVVDNVVQFDTARRRTTFERRCRECDRFFVVAGATPVFLKVTEPLPDTLHRTDIEFGTGDEQHPLIIIGPGLAEALRAASLTGVDLRPVSGEPPS